jgi:hypothetical protein
MLSSLAPHEYRGQSLCPRCGDDGTGHRYFICADKAGYSHEESCALYTYGGLCAECEIRVQGDIHADESRYQDGWTDGRADVINLIAECHRQIGFNGGTNTPSVMWDVLMDAVSGE